MSRRAALAAAISGAYDTGKRFIVIRVGREFVAVKGDNPLGQTGRWKNGQKFEVVSVIA